MHDPATEVEEKYFKCVGCEYYYDIEEMSEQENVCQDCIEDELNFD